MEAMTPLVGPTLPRSGFPKRSATSRKTEARRVGTPRVVKGALHMVESSATPPHSQIRV